MSSRTIPNVLNEIRTAPEIACRRAEIMAGWGLRQAGNEIDDGCHKGHQQKHGAWLSTGCHQSSQVIKYLQCAALIQTLSAMKNDGVGCWAHTAENIDGWQVDIMCNWETILLWQLASVLLVVVVSIDGSAYGGRDAKMFDWFSV
jgi:hypothetical protein